MHNNNKAGGRVGGKRKPGTIIINKPDRSTFFAFFLGRRMAFG